MSVIGITSDKIQPEGNYISPSAPLPETGRFWNYRVFKSPKCEFYSVCRAYYKDGKFLFRAVYPEKVTGYSPDDMKQILDRLEEARQAPVMTDREELDRKAIDLASYFFDNSFPACNWDDCYYYANELLYFGESVPRPIFELWTNRK